VVECLPSKLKALNSKSSAAKFQKIQKHVEIKQHTRITNGLRRKLIEKILKHLETKEKEQTYTKI
jgi:hypothetical protein